MSTTAQTRLVDRLADQSLPIDQRIDAARSLALDAEPDVLEALYRLARAEDNDVRVQHATGEAIAGVLLRAGRVGDAPLWDFTGPAYLGFDTVVANAQRR